MSIGRITKEYPSHFLHPGNIFCVKEPTVVSTILGSCVSVCLIDPFLGTGGINHYLMPLWNGDGLPSPRYGNIAIEKLIDKMVFNGSKKSNLQAKIFGGASITGNTKGFMNIGERNIVVAKDLLASHNIKILNSSLGGDRGRRLFFFSWSGKVKIKEIQKTSVKNEKN